MKILSESIVDYIDLNYDIESITNQKDLDVVEELVINRYNYSLEDCPFYPEELAYFTHLKKCTFLNFSITDEIVAILNQLKLEELVVDHCNCLFGDYLKVEKIFVEGSEVPFSHVMTHKLVVLENKVMDLDMIIHNNLLEMTILNTPLIHCTQLYQLKDCKIVIQGCSLDDESIKTLANVSYDPNRYEKIQ